MVILMVDSDKTRRVRLTVNLSRQGHQVQLATNRTDALQIARGITPKLVLLDLNAGGLSCEMFIGGLAAIAPDAKIFTMPRPDFDIDVEQEPVANIAGWDARTYVALYAEASRLRRVSRQRLASLCEVINESRGRARSRISLQQ
jgi:CheY-like chemotaxis protein